jgi:hypothetical protein
MSEPFCRWSRSWELAIRLQVEYPPFTAPITEFANGFVPDAAMDYIRFRRFSAADTCRIGADDLA